MLKRARRILTIIAAFVGVSVSAAHAASIQFASFQQQPTDVDPLSWVDNPTALPVPTGTILVNQAPVQFEFTQAPLPTGTFNATLSLYSGTSPTSNTFSTTAAATSFGGFDIQSLNQTITLTITDNSVPVNQPGYNLLTAVITNATLYGQDGSFNVTTSGTNGTGGTTVVYSSDYLGFAGQNSFNLGLNPLFPSGLSIDPGDNIINSFSSDLDGLFSSGSIVITPEPGSFAIVCLGGLALLRRNRVRADR